MVLGYVLVVFCFVTENMCQLYRLKRREQASSSLLYGSAKIDRADNLTSFNSVTVEQVLLYDAGKMKINNFKWVPETGAMKRDFKGVILFLHQRNSIRVTAFV
jgi:hypothetical protein